MHFQAFSTSQDALPGFLDKPGCISGLFSTSQDLNLDNLDFSRLFNCSISLSSRLSRFPWKQNSNFPGFPAFPGFYPGYICKGSKNGNKNHDPIKRQKLVLFKNTGKKVLVRQQQKQKVIEMNRNIFGTLLAYSAKDKSAINFKHALA